MLGNTHNLVANLALTCLSQPERHILYPRWGGIEEGAILSDRFKIQWEIESVDSKEKQLVHRCWVDSDDKKNHGCLTRAANHAEGSVSFTEAYLDGDLEGAYDEVSFLENLGMFLGIASHHIADLCTPVHVGHKIDYKRLGYPSLSKLHSKVERDIFRYQNQASVKMHRPKIVDLSEKHFRKIAEETYENLFLKLEHVYASKIENELLNISSTVISCAVKHTSNVWHTVLSNTRMTDKKWSMEALI
jgi:hypothetical protein